MSESARFGVAVDEHHRLRAIRTFEGNELRVMDVPEEWSIAFYSDVPDEMVDAAFEAAFPGLPAGMTVEEAKRRLRAGLNAALTP